MKHNPVLSLVASVLFFSIILGSCDLFEREFSYSGTKRALFIGVGDYDDIEDPKLSNDLPNTVNDAEDMFSFFSYYGYTSTKLLDRAATKQAITDELNSIAAVAKTDDITLVYFSGHGDGMYRATPYSKLSDPGFPSENYKNESSLIPYTDPIISDNIIYSTEFLDMIDAIPGKKVIIIDICHAGGFVFENSFDIDGLPDDYGYVGDPFLPFQIWDRYFSGTESRTYENIWVIGSAGAHELAYEDTTINNGYFTYYLLSGLGFNHDDQGISQSISADRNKDGIITISEAYGEAFNLLTHNYNNNYLIPSINKYYPHFTGSPMDLILFETGN